MKQDSLQHLLDKYREGAIDSSELEQLNRLTHRDEVMKAAEGRARTIVRRRNVLGICLAMSSAAVLGISLWILLPKAEEPLLAKLQEEQSPAIIPAENNSPHADATVSMPKEMDTKSRIAKQVRSTAAATRQEALPDSRVAVSIGEPVIPEDGRRGIDAEPVVVCNSQCDADSVISEIWKFLSA